MKQILMLVDNIFDELELMYPKIRLKEAGHEVTLAGPDTETIYHSKHGFPCSADIRYSKVKASNFHGIVIPGGYAPDRFRRDPNVLKAVREVYEAGKLVAFICHGGWVPISAKIVRGRRVTSTIAIKDDLENAGATWEDFPVVTDGNLISSRTPEDLPVFMPAILDWLARH